MCTHLSQTHFIPIFNLTKRYQVNLKKKNKNYKTVKNSEIKCFCNLLKREA